MVDSKTDGARCWGPSLLGGLLLVATVLVFLVTPRSNSLVTAELLVTGGLSLLLVGYGNRLRTTKRRDQMLSILRWSLLGMLTVGVLAGWEMSLHVLDGSPLVESLHETLFGATVGASAGTVVGRYDIEQTEESREAETYRKAVLDASDGIAILTDDKTFKIVNEAFAELHGVDDPEQMIGEHWRRCFADDEFESVESDVLPTLRAAGEWRGELTCRRRDGGTFPSETSLTYTEDNGIVCVVRDVTERKEFESKLRRLQELTTDIMSAESADTINEQLVSVAQGLIGMPLAGVWEYDEADDQLVPVAVPDEGAQYAAEFGYEEVPPLQSGTPAMQSYKRGTPQLLAEYKPGDDPNALMVELGATLLLPLGDYGLLTIASPERKQISESDQFLAEVLAMNAELALERLTNERELEQRERRLRTVIENMPVILFALDQDRTIRLQMGAGLGALGLEQNAQVGQRLSEAYGEDSPIIEAAERAYAGESVDTTLDLGGRTYRVWYEPVEERDVETNVIGVAMDISESARRERGIRALHDVTRGMIRETDPGAICDIALRTAVTDLGLPVVRLWLRNGDRDVLDPVAWSETAAELVGGTPDPIVADGPRWAVFDEGDARFVDDIDELAIETDLDGLDDEFVVPIGQYGLLSVAGTESAPLDETDLLLAQLLVANTRSALERAEHEKAIQHRTEQMEFFNSILRHDVLNGMTVIRSRAEFLTEDLEGQQLSDAETIETWSDDIVEMIQHIRSILDTLTGDQTTPLEPVDLTALLRSELERVRVTYPEVAVETDIPEGVSVRANELLGDVLGNVITNATSHNDTEGLELSVGVEPGDEVVTVRIADNGRGVPDTQKEEIFRRGETGHVKSTGSGFGLFFVDSMIREYGGTVHVEDNDPHGAVFVLELPAISPKAVDPFSA